MAYSNSALRKQFVKYKYIVIGIMVAIYSLFILLMSYNLSVKMYHDEVVIIRFGLITLTTILFILVLRIITLKAREFHTLR